MFLKSLMHLTWQLVSTVEQRIVTQIAQRCKIIAEVIKISVINVLLYFRILTVRLIGNFYGSFDVEIVIISLGTKNLHKIGIFLGYYFNRCS